MVKNKLFYEKLKKLVDKTITFFDEIELNKKKLIIKIDPNDERSYQTIEVPSYELLIMGTSSFYQLDEYRDCITTIQEDQILNEHFTKLIIIDNGSRRLFSSRTLDLICAEILEQHKNNSTNNFERIYKDLEELLYNDKIPIIITLPVSNISRLKK
jgi:hypothetical protein